MVLHASIRSPETTEKASIVTSKLASPEQWPWKWIVSIKDSSLILDAASRSAPLIIARLIQSR